MINKLKKLQLKLVAALVVDLFIIFVQPPSQTPKTELPVTVEGDLWSVQTTCRMV